ncbi:hypothetical protein DIE04_19515 [Burkholderia sp. Bp8994]|nr:hypothetical protein DIE20_15520 [Burkholderia sp. Bp9131]RQR71403.1 hypothetical protein DIE12_18480 [Burkholderia sp. Bp9015]RQR81431.1 hypothetical protein DIE10_17660 [Burkholderia sp. Bp9011]RQR91006.1 hypothetical protein DIE09_19895 [Burkholderia sp. Bp9010]RQR94027.1 hypothetical protein DIE04_19515 [Burkholderia sp. Bp8994]RQS03600.1 hypothetical protein DIE02_20010 [Burkholderia sp. Bp8991]RQS27773.1 hypothetical protein DIE05_17050 [Burkholderia sp. Bp8995]RQS38234.1 hypothetic
MRKSASNARQIAKTRAYRRPIYRDDRGSSQSLTGGPFREASASRPPRPIPRSGRTARPSHAPGPPAACGTHPLVLEQEERT